MATRFLLPAQAFFRANLRAFACPPSNREGGRAAVQAWFRPLLEHFFADVSRAEGAAAAAHLSEWARRNVVDKTAENGWRQWSWIMNRLAGVWPGDPTNPLSGVFERQRAYALVKELQVTVLDEPELDLLTTWAEEETRKTGSSGPLRTVVAALKVARSLESR